MNIRSATLAGLVIGTDANNVADRSMRIISDFGRTTIKILITD